MTITAFIAATGAAVAPWPAPVAAVTLIGSDDAAARHFTGRRVLARLAAEGPDRPLVRALPASDWPFDRLLGLPADLPPDAVVWAPDVHAAFENAQTNATRLVTTHPQFVGASWQGRLRPGVSMVATADAASLATHAPDLRSGHGAWATVRWLDAPPAPGAGAPPAAPLSPLATAVRAPSPADRLAAVGRALVQARTPARLLAMASVCMEVNDLDNAGALLDEAAGLDGSWAAIAFEQGKYALRRDDMPAAATAFARAARLLPDFGPASANLGAVLGELDRPDEAMAAFQDALRADPDHPQVHNNLGVLLRETGRLGESEASFRRVIARAPDMAFGHYNLGHTLFLQGRYQAALAAYQAGQRLDAARSPVQASRLAMARLATGDAAGALRDLQGCLANLPRDYRRQLLADTQSVAWALLSAMPELRDWRTVGDWLAAELAKG